MCANLIDIKFPLKYFENWSDLHGYKDSCDRIIDKSFEYDLDEGSKVFITATQNLLNGDSAIQSGMFDRALVYLETAERLFLSLLSNQNFPLILLTESQRRSLYSKARKQYAQALQYKKSHNDPLSTINMLRTTTDTLNQEIYLNQQNHDMHHLILAIRMLSLIFMQMSELQANIEINYNRDPRRYFYSAISNAKKAIFVGAEEDELEKKIQRWNNFIAQKTVERYIGRCDVLFDDALNLATQENFIDSAKKFWHAAKYYEHIQRISESQELVLQQKLMESGCYEQLAKNLMQEDNNSEASEYFLKARGYLSSTINTIREYGQSEMVLFLSVQHEFYEEMAAFCNAIQVYDNDQTEEALEQFEITLEALRKTNTTATNVKNTSVEFSSLKAIEQVESYIETIKIML